MKIAEMSEDEKAELEAAIKAEFKKLAKIWMDRVREQEEKE